MSFILSPKQINTAFQTQFLVQDPWLKSYNIAPTQPSLIITNDAPNLIQTMEWGLIPNWSSSSTNKGGLINARAETVTQKPSFSMPIAKRRCLVLADSFYEWKKVGKNKIPYRIVPTSTNLLVFAGIWDTININGQLKSTFSIITTAPNQEMSSIHNRMPLLLPSLALSKQWLSAIPLAEVVAMMHPPQDNLLSMYRVSDKLNNVRYNAAELHTPLPDIPTLF